MTLMDRVVRQLNTRPCFLCGAVGGCADREWDVELAYAEVEARHAADEIPGVRKGPEIETQLPLPFLVQKAGAA